MNRVFIVKHRGIKRGGSSLHLSNGRFVSVHFHGWFAHGTLDRF